MIKRQNYWVIVFITFFFSLFAHAEEPLPNQDKVNLSPFFIQLSDAMVALKSDKYLEVEQHLTEIKHGFMSIPQNQSLAGQDVIHLLSHPPEPIDLVYLTEVSKAFLAFEEEQTPVDIVQQKALFKKHVMPAFIHFQQQIDRAVQQSMPHQLVEDYRVFNAIWSKNERSVRNVSRTDYGVIETNLALLRVAIEKQPIDFDKVVVYRDRLAQNFAHFLEDSPQIVLINDNNYHLSDGIHLLQQAQQQWKRGDSAEESLTKFIEIWPLIENEVSTRDNQLYQRVEQQIPIILAQEMRSTSQQQLSHLVVALQSLDVNAHYSIWDAMVILLREGLEALLIIVALASSLRAIGRKDGYQWVVSGAVSGVLASILLAASLYSLFPRLTASVGREFLEGITGIVAVIAMLFIGIWLHSKSSLQAWQQYLQKNMNIALKKGGLWAFFVLSFLSVFREGAETLLFYVSMFSQITLVNFMLGIGSALLILLLTGIAMMKLSLRLPIPLMFKGLTLLLYMLGFKMLGVSIHILQLTQVLPLTLVTQLPTVSAIGLYPSLETLGAQLVYILVIIVSAYYMRLHILKTQEH